MMSPTKKILITGFKEAENVHNEGKVNVKERDMSWNRMASASDPFKRISRMNSFVRQLELSS